MRNIKNKLLPKPLIVIGGPTATGKTDLALSLCQKFNGEIISADSRQVYKNLDIGSGKIKSGYKVEKFEGKWIVNGIPIHLYDVSPPNFQYTVADFVRDAKRVIRGIWQKDRLPFLVGGTGFYINALTSAIETLGILPNPKVRKEYEKKSAEELLELLQNLDPKKASSLNESDRQNPRRLIRAIEILLSKKITVNREPITVNYLILGLTAPKEVLFRRIDEWLGIRMRKGLIKEVETLLQKGVSKSWLYDLGLEYRFVSQYLLGKLNKKDMINHLQNAIHNFAKRQLTWFKKDKRVIRFDITEKNYKLAVEKRIKKWLNL